MTTIMLVMYKDSFPSAAGSGWGSVIGPQSASSQAPARHCACNDVQQLNGIRWLPGDPHDHVTCLHASPLLWCHVKMLTNHVLCHSLVVWLYLLFFVCLRLVPGFLGLVYSSCLLCGVLCFCMESLGVFLWVFFFFFLVEHLMNKTSLESFFYWYEQLSV